MSFISTDYLIFFSIVFCLYYAFPKYQLPLIVVASCIFYGYEKPFFLILLVTFSVFTSVITYLIANKSKGNYNTLKIGVTISLLVLGFFKYKFLFVEGNQSVGLAFADFLIAIPLPIGISFFVFHAISMMVDTYRGVIDKSIFRENFLTYTWKTFIYIAFFPQLVAGPIAKASQFFPQFTRKSLADVCFLDSFKWIIWGYFFKRFVADNLNQFTVWMDNGNFQRLGSGDLLLLVFSYSAQIFADFAGYSAIAIGSAALLGYRLPINFDRPYTAVSFSDFWRKWHMSLSSFLREYLYIPLGGNRKGKLRTYVNLMITMSLGGIWHGAAVSYMLWGALHGAFLVLEQLLNTRQRTGLIYKYIYMIFVFTCVSILWLFFKLTNYQNALEYLYLIFSAKSWFFFQKPVYTLVAIYALPVFIHHAYRVNGNSYWQAPIYALMLFLSYFDAGQSDAFIYFRF